MDSIVHSVEKSQTWLSDFHFHFLFLMENSANSLFSQDKTFPYWVTYSQSPVTYEVELTDPRGKFAEDGVVPPALTPHLCVFNYKDKFWINLWEDE